MLEVLTLDRGGPIYVCSVEGPLYPPRYRASHNQMAWLSGWHRWLKDALRWASWAEHLAWVLGAVSSTSSPTCGLLSLTPHPLLYVVVFKNDFLYRLGNLSSTISFSYLSYCTNNTGTQPPPRLWIHEQIFLGGGRGAQIKILQKSRVTATNNPYESNRMTQRIA